MNTPMLRLLAYVAQNPASPTALRFAWGDKLVDQALAEDLVGFAHGSHVLSTAGAYLTRAGQAALAAVPSVPCSECGGAEDNVRGCLACCRDCGFPCSFEKDAEAFHAEG